MLIHFVSTLVSSKLCVFCGVHGLFVYIHLFGITNNRGSPKPSWVIAITHDVCLLFRNKCPNKSINSHIETSCSPPMWRAERSRWRVALYGMGSPPPAPHSATLLMECGSSVIGANLFK